MTTLANFSLRKLVDRHRENVIAFSLASVLVMAGSIEAQEANSSHAVKIRRVDDVIENWSPDQHLYVKGEVGASDVQLGKLEQWLDTHGPHWTVVLMNQARDEHYSAPDGEKFRAMDAVEFALAHRLANQTEFGQLVHPKTGETSGAVFVLYLTEREFAYYSTDVYDRRGLGQSRWVGNLDREVIRAMRSGDRIIDAVKNTVSMIEGRLEKQIDKEISDAKRANEQVRIERTRDIENLKTLVNETETSWLARVETSAREIRTRYPDASQSELAQPPLDQWKAGLANLRKESENPDFLTADLKRSKAFRDAREGIQKIRVEINRFLDSYAAHRAFDDMINPVEARLDAIADHPSGVATPTSAEAYRLLDESRGGHARGELGFASYIEQAVALIEQGEQAIEVEQQRIQKEADRKRLIRRTLMYAAMGLVVFSGLLFWILNTRRRPALRRAHALFEKRSKAVENEVAKTEELIAHSERVIGTRESFADQNYQGQTLTLGSSTHQRIGNLKDISTEVLREIGLCYELLHPSNPIAEATNLFSSARYEHCINQLNGQTLQIPGRVDENGVVGEPIWMTFDELFSDMYERKRVVDGNLETLGNSLSQVKSQVHELQVQINRGTELEKKLSRAARLDRYFRIPALFEKLLPSVQSDCDRVAPIADTDPVQAVAEHIPVGRRKMKQALDLAETIEKARDTLLPQLEESGKSLQQLGFDNRWMSERLEDLSDRSNEILTNAVQREVAEEVAQFDADVNGFGLRMRRCGELALEILNVVEPNLESLRKRIVETRTTIAGKLGIDVSNVLREDQYDPEVEFAHALEQLQSARAAINYGGVESVMESLEVLEIESNQVEQLMKSSLNSLSEFDSNFAAGTKLANSLPINYRNTNRRLNPSNDAMPNRRSRCATKSSWEGLGTGLNLMTIRQRLNACCKLAQDLVGHARNALATTHACHFSGRILEGANLLELIRIDLNAVEEMLGEIGEHCQQTDQLAAENTRRLEQRTKKLNALVGKVADNRIQRPTIQVSSDLAMAVKGFAAEYEREGSRRDPFADSIELSQFESRIEDLETALHSDRSAFEEASRAVLGAEAELAIVNQLVAHSINDKIPDSQTIARCQAEVTSLEIELMAVKNRLGVAHENWQMVNVDANQLNSKLGVIGGRMRQELELAQQAVQALSEASDAVYEAANWRGSYRITVVGNPGSHELEEARKWLSEGNYARSLELSRISKSSARNAIDHASQQVERHRRKLAREAAEARRRRESRAASFVIGSSGSSSIGSSFGRSSSSGSSFGSSSRSSSHSSSSGSPSRSSSSGRSSGFSRSKW